MANEEEKRKLLLEIGAVEDSIVISPSESFSVSGDTEVFQESINAQVDRNGRIAYLDMIFMIGFQNGTKEVPAERQGRFHFGWEREGSVEAGHALLRIEYGRFFDRPVRSPHIHLVGHGDHLKERRVTIRCNHQILSIARITPLRFLEILREERNSGRFPIDVRAGDA